MDLCFENPSVYAIRQSSHHFECQKCNKSFDIVLFNSADGRTHLPLFPFPRFWVNYKEYIGGRG